MFQGIFKISKMCIGFDKSKRNTNSLWRHLQTGGSICELTPHQCASRPRRYNNANNSLQMCLYSFRANVVAAWGN